MISGVPGAHSVLLLPRNIRVPGVYKTMDSGVPGTNPTLVLPGNIRVPPVLNYGFRCPWRSLGAGCTTEYSCSSSLKTMVSGVPGAHSALLLPRNIHVPAV